MIVMAMVIVSMKSFIQRWWWWWWWWQLPCLRSSQRGDEDGGGSCHAFIHTSDGGGRGGSCHAFIHPSVVMKMVVVVVMPSFTPVMVVVVVVVAMPSSIPLTWRARWCTPGTCGVGVCVCAATGKVYEYNTRTHERRWLESPPGYVWTPRRHSPLSVNTTPSLATTCDTLTPYNMWYLDSLQHLVLWLTTTCETHTLTHYNISNTHRDSLQHVKLTPSLTTTCQTHTLTHYMSNSHLSCLKHPSWCQSIPASALVRDR